MKKLYSILCVILCVTLSFTSVLSMQSLTVAADEELLQADSFDAEQCGTNVLLDAEPLPYEVTDNLIGNVTDSTLDNATNGTGITVINDTLDNGTNGTVINDTGNDAIVINDTNGTWNDEGLPVITINTEDDPIVSKEPLLIEIEREDYELKKIEDDTSALLQDEDFITLCATIHFEAGEANSIEAKYCVGRVIINRLNDYDTWGYDTIQDVCYADRQFSVVHMRSFDTFKDQLRSCALEECSLNECTLDECTLSTIESAKLVLNDPNFYPCDPAVQYFNIDHGLKSWGGHAFAFECGGNAFYYK